MYQCRRLQVKGSPSISKDSALDFNYHPQRLLMMNGTQKVKARGPRDVWAGLRHFRWEGKARTGQALLLCSLEDTFHARRHIPPHPLTSHWKPIEASRSLVNPQSKKPGIFHFQWQTGNEEVKHGAVRKRGKCSTSCCGLSVANLCILVGFFLLSFFENAFYTLEIPFFFCSVIFVVIFSS